MSPVDADIAQALLKVYQDLEHSYFLALRDTPLNDTEKKSLSKVMLATVEGAIMAAKVAQNKAPYIEIVTQMFKLYM